MVEELLMPPASEAENAGRHVAVDALALIVGIAGGLGAVLLKLFISFFHIIFFDILYPRLHLIAVSGYRIDPILLPALGRLVAGPILYKVAPET